MTAAQAEKDAGAPSGARREVLIVLPGLLLAIMLAMLDQLIVSTALPRIVGTLGGVTLFGSYNGVRSDSVQFFFPAACSDHNHLYHGPQVNNQVPPPIIG